MLWTLLANVELALDEVERKLIFKWCRYVLAILLAISHTMSLYLPLLLGRLTVAALPFASTPTTRFLSVGNCKLLHPSLQPLHLSNVLFYTCSSQHQLDLTCRAAHRDSSSRSSTDLCAYYYPCDVMMLMGVTSLAPSIHIRHLAGYLTL